MPCISKNKNKNKHPFNRVLITQQSYKMTASNIVKVLCAHSRVMTADDTQFLPFFDGDKDIEDYRVGYSYDGDVKLLYKSSDKMSYSRKASHIELGYINGNLVDADVVYDIAEAYFNIKLQQYKNDLKAALQSVEDKSSFMMLFEIMNELPKPVVFKEGF